jgi:hypothetical protein
VTSLSPQTVWRSTPSKHARGLVGDTLFGVRRRSNQFADDNHLFLIAGMKGSHLSDYLHTVVQLPTNADKSDDDKVDSETTERYRDLVDTIQAWDAENAQRRCQSSPLPSFLSHSHFLPQHFANGVLPSSDIPREEPDHTKASAGTSAAQSRRAKNAAHRVDDVGACSVASWSVTHV